MQWAINAYLLTLAALFAFGGRLADTAGHRKMVVLGVIIFAGASALCGATPRGGAAEAWLVAFRAVQGAGGAIMFPAAIAIVVVTFDLRSRGRALALFFGIAGALTAIGPIAGGYLIQWTWRSIFWINIPVALIALALIAISDAINRASRYSYGEATGITQTVRNYGASLGFAILGTVLITRFRSQITSSLTARGLPGPAAAAEAAKTAQLQGGNGSITAIPPFIRADFAAATRDVLYGMTIIMAVAFVVALRGLTRGVQQETETPDDANDALRAAR